MIYLDRWCIILFLFLFLFVYNIYLNLLTYHCILYSIEKVKQPLPPPPSAIAPPGAIAPCCHRAIAPCCAIAPIAPPGENSSNSSCNSSPWYNSTPPSAITPITHYNSSPQCNSSNSSLQ